jgi:RND family efflux transporter MFP subunit
LALLPALLLALARPAVGAPAAADGELDCLIEPFVVVNLSSPVEGVLERLAVDRGDLVKQGQVLVHLESSLEKAAVESARYRSQMEGAIKTNEARLDFSSKKLGRTEDLFKKDIVPAGDLDEAVTTKIIAERSLLEAMENKRLAELELQRATAALNMRTIASPINGVVVERFLAPGEFAKQTPILKLAQINPLRVEVFAPVSLLGKVSIGMRAEVRPEAPVGGVQTARVTVVDRVVDAASGTFGVRLEIPNPSYKLPAGLKCRMKFLPK